MATRGRRRAERLRRKVRPAGPDGLALDVPTGRWEAARRRARTLLVATTLAGLVVWAGCCAVVQSVWPPLLLSPGGAVVVASTFLLAGVCSYRLGRRVAARAARSTLDDLRAALPGARPTQPRWWTHDQVLDVLLGRETVLLRGGRRTLVSADVRGGAVVVAATVAVAHGYLGDPAVPGMFVDLSDGGWSGGGDGGGSSS